MVEPNWQKRLNWQKSVKYQFLQDLNLNRWPPGLLRSREGVVQIDLVARGGLVQQLVAEGPVRMLVLRSDAPHGGNAQEESALPVKANVLVKFCQGGEPGMKDFNYQQRLTPCQCGI